MSAAYKNKHGEEVVSQSTYLRKEIKEQFKIKCKTKGVKPSSVLRQFIHQYINN